MPNDVTNKLRIHCDDETTMDKIKMMIFDVNKNQKRIFTMGKMLPLPKRFSNMDGYNDYGYDWCIAVWGTKWDVYDCNILESGDTIAIDYQTAWNPNDTWFELFCIYIQTTLNHLEPNERPHVSVKLQYYDYMGDFGGIMDWVPFEKLKQKRYSFMEFAKMYDKDAYEWACELEQHLKGRNLLIK